MHAYCFLTNCVTMCVNEACFVRFECDTRSISRARDILSVKYSMHGAILDAKLRQSIII